MAEDPNAKFAIHAASREGQTSKVESLLNANPKLASLRDEDDRLPIHWAVSYNRLPIVQILVQAKNFDVDAKDASGWTPLMMACSRKEAEEVVNLLLGKGAEVNEKSTSSSFIYGI
ncbi:ankyrin repeat-containing domain protein [Lophiotrema nucula]|uniref:Ankyrin repeat-containing domain protein n=1 Tax=Lophiotrema nucula TaxID=690887 RepID=A0A6A5ZR51_9PLEO|nr:ankyrin repeat-containing domain protein [Lophiotrema nucula]